MRLENLRWLVGKNGVAPRDLHPPSFVNPYPPASVEISEHRVGRRLAAAHCHRHAELRVCDMAQPRVCDIAQPRVCDIALPGVCE